MSPNEQAAFDELLRRTERLERDVAVLSASRPHSAPMPMGIGYLDDAVSSTATAATIRINVNDPNAKKIEATYFGIVLDSGMCYAAESLVFWFDNGIDRYWSPMACPTLCEESYGYG